MNKKQNLFFFLKSLINNDTAVMGGRTKKWWIALILYFVSIFIAVIPTMISVGKTKGSAIFTGDQFHSDVAMIKFNESLATNDVDLIFEDSAAGPILTNPSANYAFTFDKTLEITDETSVVFNFPYYTFARTETYTIENSDGTTTEETKVTEHLRVYYVASMDGFVFHGGKHLTPEVYLANYLAKAKSTEEKIVSHFILGKNGITIRIYNPTKATEGKNVERSYNGVYKKVPVGLNIKNFYLKDKGGNPLDSTAMTFKSEVLASWANLVDVAYGPVKVNLFFAQSGLSLLVYAVISAFIGLVIFLSTRGKNNPNRSITFKESMQIGCWLLLSPALITLVIGSFLPQYAALIYVATLGMRSVWLTMKSLRPVQPAK